MNRILEFSSSQEEAVVSRILVLVHQAVDEHFPAASHANRQFTKTVFSSEGEQTGGMRVADGHAPAAFATSEDTSPVGRPVADSGGGHGHAALPPPPGMSRDGGNAREAAGRQGAAGRSGAKAPPGGAADAATPQKSPPSADRDAAPPTDSRHSRATGLDTTIKGIKGTGGPDWVTRITLALLLAGVVLLGYLLLT